MATKVEESGFEVDASLGVMRPELNGLRDLAALHVGPDPGDMSPQAHEQAVQSIARHERRITALLAVKTANQVLMDDGHPNMPPVAIDPATLQSIRDNAASVALAASTFVSNVMPAANLNPTAGAIEPKP